MRPIATEQNALRFPLNQLLGTQAHVRLLRILANEVVGPITTSDAAARAGLTEAGARRALVRLAKTGFVRRVGGGVAEDGRSAGRALTKLHSSQMVGLAVHSARDEIEDLKRRIFKVGMISPNYVPVLESSFKDIAASAHDMTCAFTIGFRLLRLRELPFQHRSDESTGGVALQLEFIQFELQVLGELNDDANQSGHWSEPR